MSTFGGNDPSGTIRITKEEATSSHVDDMLKRQASLRGEGGIRRSGKGKWYLQNWFVFSIVGCLAAIGGWALLEPWYDDVFYIQGTITALDAMPGYPTVRFQGQVVPFDEHPTVG